MSDLTFEVLDTASDAVREYESAFYQSFAKVETNRLVRNLWHWDTDARRIRTRVPYEDQVICALRNQTGQFLLTMAFNVELRQFQAAAYGFAPPQASAGTFEVLTFFTPAAQTLDVCAGFWSNCLAVLRGRGLTAGYATTARRPLPMYRRVGWRVLQEQEIEAEKRYFLRYEVPPCRP